MNIFKKIALNFLVIYFVLYLGFIISNVFQEQILRIPLEIDWISIVLLSIIGTIFPTLTYLAFLYILSIFKKEISGVSKIWLSLCTLISMIGYIIVGLVLEDMNNEWSYPIALFIFLGCLTIKASKR